MANITLTIPNAQVSRVVAGLIRQHGYARLPGQTDAEVVKAILAAHIIASCKNREAGVAVIAATNTANDLVDSEIPIT